MKILLKSKLNYSYFKLTTLFPKIFGSSCTLLAYVFFNVKNVLPLPCKTPANLPTWEKKKKGKTKLQRSFFFILCIEHWTEQKKNPHLLFSLSETQLRETLTSSRRDRRSQLFNAAFCLELACRGVHQVYAIDFQSTLSWSDDLKI